MVTCSYDTVRTAPLPGFCCKWPLNTGKSYRFGYLWGEPTKSTQRHQALQINKRRNLPHPLIGSLYYSPRNKISSNERKQVLSLPIHCEGQNLSLPSVSGDAEGVSTNRYTAPKPHATGEMSKTVIKGERTWTDLFTDMLSFSISASFHGERHLMLCFCLTDRLAHLFARACRPQGLIFPQGISSLAPVTISESQCLWATKAAVTGSIYFQGTPRKFIFIAGLCQIPLLQPQSSQKFITLY